MTPMTANDRLEPLLMSALGVKPTADQYQAIREFCRFMSDADPFSVMILRGSAGTGKTTLAAAVVRALVQLRHRIALLAPTGRAAKVMELYSCHTAFTIHRRIYRQKVAGTFSPFSLADNKTADCLFIVDESSMIANQGLQESNFGTGRLLDDLIQYVYQGQNCRLLLVGDAAQLPPVGEESSPALQSPCLQGYGLKVYEADLQEVLRQSIESGILFNATRIRCLTDTQAPIPMPKIRLQGFADIRTVRGDELIESLASSYAEVGIDETMVLTRSNKRANIYNQGIRARILDREDELTSGDMLMVVKNNYHWAAASGLQKEDEKPKLSFIANGDRAQVLRVRKTRSFYGFRFADVTLRFPDYDDQELTATAILDSLQSEAPALTREQQQQLFDQVWADYADIPHKKDRMDKLKQDPYYNALQVKFAYAVTCHKAQGGQWQHIYIDQGYMTDDMLTPDYIHWLYTAFTRATGKLFLVNWAKEYTE